MKALLVVLRAGLLILFVAPGAQLAVARQPSVLPPLAESGSDVVREAWNTVRCFADVMGVPADLGLAVMLVESGGHPQAVSPRGARGVMQVMEGTATAHGCNPRRLHELDHGAYCGLAVLARLLEQYPVPAALAGYVAGPDFWAKNYPRETRLEIETYVNRVLAKRAEIAGRVKPGCR